MFSTQLYSPEGTRAYGKTGRQTRRVSATKKKKKHRGRQAYCKIVPGSTETVLQTYHKDLILN